jgi:hypothetical protein
MYHTSVPLSELDILWKLKEHSKRSVGQLPSGCLAAHGHKVSSQGTQRFATLTVQSLPAGCRGYCLLDW